VYIWPADPIYNTSFSLSALVFVIHNICHVPLFTLLAYKKSRNIIVVFKLISFKHEGNTLKSKRIVHYLKIYLFHTKAQVYDTNFPIIRHKRSSFCKTSEIGICHDNPA
jgi:hypothetical protein